MAEKLWSPDAPGLVPRTDDEGHVYIAFTPEALEAFTASLNDAGVVMERGIAEYPDLPGVAMLLNYTPRYAGYGIATIEVLTTAIDRCDGGLVCSRHPWLPPQHPMGTQELPGGAQHARCKAPGDVCLADRHSVEAPPEDREDQDHAREQQLEAAVPAES